LVGLTGNSEGKKKPTALDDTVSVADFHETLFLCRN